MQFLARTSSSIVECWNKTDQPLKAYVPTNSLALAQSKSYHQGSTQLAVLSQ